MFITAVNDGATAVAQVNVTTNDPLTIVRGTVVGTNGLPVAGAEVRLPAFDLTAITDANGRYEFRDVPSRLGNIVVTAEIRLPNGEEQSGQTAALTPLPDGITEAGQIITAPIPGLVAWWRADGDALDSAGTNYGTLTNGASFGPGKNGQAFALDGTNDFAFRGE